MVLYNPAARYGASEEADNLEQALTSAGCDVTKMSWLNANEIHNMIESSLQSMVHNCSLLIVCIMAHGSRGVLKGSEGEDKPVNDILHQLKHLLPSFIPLVSVLPLYTILTGS